MDKVKKFLSNYQSPNTIRNYKVALKNFFTTLYGSADKDTLDEHAEKYFDETRNYEIDIEDFVRGLNGQAPLTIKLKLSQIKTFLIENDVELSQRFWRKVRRKIKGNRPLTLDKIPSNKELRKLLTHMPVQGKALFLLLESSGMRIGEGLQLNLDDLQLTEEPGRIQIRGEYTKTGNSRHAFISRETKETIIEWLKVRENYLRGAAGKSHLYKKSVEDSRIFPFDSATAYSIWRKALHKAKLNGKDKSTGREKIHPHVLRKFFRTRLGAVIPVDVVEALMGHEGYLTEVYRRYTIEDLAKFYLQGESALLVFTENQDVTKLRQEVEESKKRIEDKNEQLQNLLTELTTKNLSLENKLTGISSENQSMKREIKDLSEANKKLENGMKKVTDTLGKVIEKLENLEK